MSSLKFSVKANVLKNMFILKDLDEVSEVKVFFIMEFWHQWLGTMKRVLLIDVNINDNWFSIQYKQDKPFLGLYELLWVLRFDISYFMDKKRVFCPSRDAALV